MPIDLIFSPDRVNNPFEAYRRNLIKALADIKVPAPYGFMAGAGGSPGGARPYPRHDRSVRLLAAFGRRRGQVEQRPPRRYEGVHRSVRLRRRWLATYELEQQAQLLREDLAEAV
jgi:hypothetical protein